MSNIIGLNTKLFGLEKNIKQSEPTRAANDLGQLGDPAEKERVLNPIVSESYMQKYIEEHGGAGESFNKIDITIINDTDTAQTVSYVVTDLNSIIDGCLDKDYYYDLSIEPNESLTVTSLYERIITLEEPPTTIYRAGVLAGEVEVSNLVNCTIDTGDMSGYILITDPSLDASLTLTVTSDGNV